MAWVTWNETASTTTNLTVVWDHWIGTTSTATTTTTTTIWTGWTSGTGDTLSRPVVVAHRRAQTPEELEVLRQRQQEYEDRIRREREEKDAADKRAEELLVEHLNGRQRRQYRKDKSFTMVGRDGNRYRVTRAWGGHVLRISKGGKPLERWCVHPDRTVPLPDNQLIAKLMLETNPEEYRRIANVTPMAA